MKRFIRFSLAIILMTVGLAVASASVKSDIQAKTGMQAPADTIPGIPTTVEWLDVNIETPGSLGVEILYKVDALKDVKALRVAGTLNSADATTLTNLTSIEYLDLSSATLSSIPDQAFKDRTSLKGIVLPENITAIGSEAFYNTSLAYITVPGTVKSMGESVFYGCKKLLEAKLLGTVSVSNRMFYNDSALKKVEIAEGATSIQDYAFYNCNSLKEIILPTTLLSIGKNAFSYTTALALINLPDGVSSIQYQSFYRSGITELSLPPYVSLGESAFEDCSKLEKVILPMNFYNRGSRIFYYCSALKYIECPMPVPPGSNSSNDSFYNVPKGAATLVVPEFAVVNYKLDTFWKNFGTIEGGASYNAINLNGNLSFENNRRPENPVSVSLRGGSTLTIGGASPFDMQGFEMYIYPYYYNNNHLSSYGQLINNSPAVTSTEGILKISLEANRWYFISLPADVKLKEITHSVKSDFVIREYDGASRALKGTGSSWKDLPADATLKAGRGYIARCKTAGFLRMPLNSTDCMQVFDNTDRSLSPELHEAENAANAGWNLIGNPWPSFYDLSCSDINIPVIRWDYSNAKYIAQSMLDDNIVLKPGEAFFIQHTEDGSWTLPTTGRCFTSEGVVKEDKAKRRSPRERSLFDLTVSDGDYSDNTRIVINPHAGLAYDFGMDAAKFFSSETAAPTIYTLDDEGNPLAINERPADNGIVQLMFETVKGGTYKLSATRAEGSVSIKDLVTGEETDLLPGNSIDIELPGEGEVCSRYVALLDSDFTTGTTVISDEADSFSVRTGMGRLEVDGILGNVEVYTVDGRLAASDEGASSFTLPAGLYIVKSGKNSAKCIVY